MVLCQEYMHFDTDFIIDNLKLKYMVYVTMGAYFFHDNANQTHYILDQYLEKKKYFCLW